MNNPKLSLDQLRVLRTENIPLNTDKIRETEKVGTKMPYENFKEIFDMVKQDRKKLINSFKMYIYKYKMSSIEEVKSAICEQEAQLKELTQSIYDLNMKIKSDKEHLNQLAEREVEEKKKTILKEHKHYTESHELDIYTESYYDDKYFRDTYGCKSGRDERGRRLPYDGDTLLVSVTCEECNVNLDFTCQWEECKVSDECTKRFNALLLTSKVNEIIAI